MRVRLLDQAKADLAGLAAHYREIGGDLLARRMVQRIRGPVLALRDNPLLAPAYELAPGIRRLVVADGAFLVFYGVTDCVDVLHIRRAERAPARGGDLYPAL
jgi:plasmid stabilization system protein ParE